MLKTRTRVKYTDMAKTKIRSESALTQTIYDELFPRKMSKSDQRRLEILRGAIKAYSAVDYNSVSFDEIAKPAKTSRRLVQHYFPEKDDLFETSMKLVRAQFQALAVDALQKAKTPEDQFRAYVRSTLSWVIERREDVQTWLLFYLVCSQKPKFQKLHAELAAMGEQRIKALVREAHPRKSYTETELCLIAKSVQRLITGGIIEAMSEQGVENASRIRDEVVRTCMVMAGFSVAQK